MRIGHVSNVVQLDLRIVDDDGTVGFELPEGSVRAWFARRVVQLRGERMQHPPLCDLALLRDPRWQERDEANEFRPLRNALYEFDEESEVPDGNSEDIGDDGQFRVVRSPEIFRNSSGSYETITPGFPTDAFADDADDDRDFSLPSTPVLDERSRSTAPYRPRLGPFRFSDLYEKSESSELTDLEGHSPLESSPSFDRHSMLEYLRGACSVM